MNATPTAELLRRFADNPFYVLELPWDCTRVEVEREGQKLLSMLRLDMSGATTFSTPLGPRPRTPEMVREAMAELRDPQRRLVHELWARLSPSPRDSEPSARASAEPDRSWPDALAALGWERK